jgi:hypothetical protein
MVRGRRPTTCEGFENFAQRGAEDLAQAGGYVSRAVRLESLVRSTRSGG